MRKLLFVLLLLIPILLMVGIESRLAARLIVPTPPDGQQEDIASHLTQAEERDLIKLTGQALVWLVTWNPRPTNCSQGNEIEVVDLAKLYKQYQGLEVHATRVIRELELTVYLPQFHIWLNFRRFHDLGLGPPLVGYFCEDSYEEYIAAEVRRAEQTRGIGEEISRRAEADPQVAGVLRQLRERATQVSENKAPRQEIWNYRVLPLVESIGKPVSSWSEDKKRLYERIIAAVRKEAEGIYCPPGKIVTVTVPDFAVGDPDICVLMEAPEPYGKSIEWISFDRERSSGQYDAYHVKSHELWPSEADAPEDLLRLRDLIMQKRVKQENIICPNK